MKLLFPPLKNSLTKSIIALRSRVVASIIILLTLLTFGFENAICQIKGQANTVIKRKITTNSQIETPKLQPNILRVKLASHLLSNLGFERTQNEIPLNTVSGLTGLPLKYIPGKIQPFTPDRKRLCKAYCYFIKSWQ